VADKQLKIVAAVAILAALALALASTLETPPTTDAHSSGIPRSASPDLSFDNHETAVLDKALKKKPDHTPILLRLAKLKAKSGRRDEATGHLQEILRIEPNNLDARLELGKILFEEGNVQAAVEQNRAILQLDPDHPDALYNLGAIYGNLGQRELALQYWDRVRTAHPGSESGLRAQMSIRKLNKDQQ
jgi:tetratricopeptide (TPR) repeat protein